MTHKSLISGGAGFLGSHLCDELLKKGHDVLCVDNFFNGNKDNVSHLISSSKFELMRHDVTFPLYVVVDQIYKTVGVRLHKNICPPRSGDPAVLLADLRKAREYLDWQPRLGLSEIIFDSWQGSQQLR